MYTGDWSLKWLIWHPCSMYFCKVWLTDYSIQTLLNSICYPGPGLQFFFDTTDHFYPILFRYLFRYMEIISFFLSFFSFSSYRYDLCHIDVCISALYIRMTHDSRLSICLCILHDGLVLDAGCIDCYLYKSPVAHLQKKEWERAPWCVDILFRKSSGLSTYLFYAHWCKEDSHASPWICKQ